MKTTEQTPTTALGQREAEARRVARAEGFPIIDHNEDWTFFTLGDGLEVCGKCSYDAKEHPKGTHHAYSPKVIHTHFDWNEFRFEGFVS